MVTDWVSDKLRAIYGDGGLPVARRDATASSGCVFRDVNACEGIGREIAALRAENKRLRDGFAAIEDALRSPATGEDCLARMSPLGWHYANIIVRINGEDQHFQGDWMKDLHYALMAVRQQSATNPKKE